MLTYVIGRYNLINDMPTEDLIDQLNAFRLENRFSQPKLAKMLGVTFQTVNRWLNRRMKPGQIHEYHIRKLIKPGTK